MATTVLKVTGMTCGHCRKAVTDALESREGVVRADVDLESGVARVEHDAGRVTPEQLAEAVAEEGYEAEEAA